MRQELFLGEVLRQRYVEEMELIHDNYTRVQVLCVKTDIQLPCVCVCIFVSLYMCMCADVLVRVCMCE